MDQNSWIMGLVRAVLASLGGMLVAKGWMDDATAQTFMGALAVVVTGIWSVLAKKNATPNK